MVQSEVAQSCPTLCERALVGYSSWGPKELDKTEETACMHARHLLGVVNTAVKNNCVEVV